MSPVAEKLQAVGDFMKGFIPFKDAYDEAKNGNFGMAAVFAITDIAGGSIEKGVAKGIAKGIEKVAIKETIEVAAKTGTTALTKFYPAGNGFLGTAERTFLMPGEEINRYGSGAGKFFSPASTTLPMRALPPGANTSIFNTYNVLKPFEVQAGRIVPAFGQPGLGTQFLSPVSADILLKRGIIGLK